MCSGRWPVRAFPVRRELLIASSKESGVEAALQRYRARYEVYRKWGLSGENTPMQSGDGWLARVKPSAPAE